MKTLSKEEMKVIGGARPGMECSAGYSCISSSCWRHVEVNEIWFWVTSGETC